ncbi:unnamed protein product [Rotaria sp. Silwood1]|nr:unnamed protein product [Rotaria sp. Silwood1]
MVDATIPCLCSASIMAFGFNLNSNNSFIIGFTSFDILEIFLAYNHDHIINEQLIKPNGEKIKAITERPAPRKLKEAN